ncbi:DNA primase [Yoonia sediminilitoris]|uniref:DNA primase n=1 Tax=Yoonia sediminilitoris TaxID=1286148 RepID=A0A2T6KQE9_9RHOB|nr:DNA primase [Yoonia sediminilitoris]PUB18784.1 DNA primase [Yoonia sediminilitoris]RCW98952.1 DNA primase [Yoonia sediminilitoris]
MSLPPGFLDELRSRLSLGQVVGRKVMWDSRKSNQGKGDLWASCPFHQEKSASFHVDDRKGFYYCFGCHAKGDAISFVQDTENVGFMEAIKILADEAGLPIPQQDPLAQQKADKRTQLIDIMEQAVQYHRLQLQTGQAAAARDYLAGRGLSPDAQTRWEIGFAPAHGGVMAHLTGKGVDPKLVIEAGLAAESDRGGAPYDRFRGRIMFPIRDARGRAIGFGGRAMDPNHPAKYYNSPETALFDKGRSLFNHGPAREAAGKGKPLIVAEGYMDVIALSEAGFTATVAPLGTAITEDQLRLLWRIAAEPIIALDGDKAGLRAAMRVIDIALPLLQAGQSLRFALMPDGLDPDDLIKQQGASAMQKLIDAAIPMVQLLWQRETEGRNFDSPERRAALDKALREKVLLIQDPSIRSHYGQAIKDLRWALFSARKSAPRHGAQRAWMANKDPWRREISPVATSKNSILGAGGASEDHLREAVILATLICNPSVSPDFESALERVECRDQTHQAMQACILRHLGADDLKSAIIAEIGAAPLENLLGQSHVAISPAVRKAGNMETARLCLAEEFAKLAARQGHAREIEDAVEDLSGTADEGVTWRLAQASAALDKAGRGDNEDKAEYETGENGALMNKDERSAFDSLLNQIAFEKGSARSK